MKIFKTMEVKTPQRGTSVAAGIDFFVPEQTEEFIQAFREKNPGVFMNDGGITLNPHQRVNIPSGIKANVPKGYALIAFNKSGVSLKYGLDVGATVIDEDYQGVIHLSLTNTSMNSVHIDFGQKIVQFILIPMFYDNVELIENEDDLFDTESERGEGGFGSTGTK